VSEARWNSYKIEHVLAAVARALAEFGQHEHAAAMARSITNRKGWRTRYWLWRRRERRDRYVTWLRRRVLSDGGLRCWCCRWSHRRRELSDLESQTIY
jgi:hypothetical protein